MKIISLADYPEWLDQGIAYFWRQWGSETNFLFYEDCIRHSLDQDKPLPKFYLAIADNKIIGSYALVTNDIISRQDLVPWLACLYVEEDHRGQGLAAQLLDHGLAQAREGAYEQLYLSTDLEGFYEKKGWHYFTDAYNVSGEAFKVYNKATR